MIFPTTSSSSASSSPGYAAGGKPGDVNVNGIVATGFLALGPKMLSEQDKPKVFYDIVDEQIDVTSRAFMGLTIACARCHDHKFDPISTKDYYSLASIFASTKQLNKLEGISSQLYFAPLVPSDVEERYEEHQKKIAAKKEAIDELSRRKRTATPPACGLGWRIIWSLRAAPMPPAGQSRNSPVKTVLDLAVLEKWVNYLKPTEEVRPNLERWHGVSESSANEVAREYQTQFEATCQRAGRTLAKWKESVAAAAKGENAAAGETQISSR